MCSCFMITYFRAWYKRLKYGFWYNALRNYAAAHHL